MQQIKKGNELNGSPIGVQAGTGICLRPFGPTLYRGKFEQIDALEELCNSKRGEVDVRQELAGNIDEEWQLEFLHDKHEPILEELFDHVVSWELVNRNLTEDARMGLYETLELLTIWVNYQKPNDWNPPHNHGGHASFVIYIDNPIDFDKEAEYSNQKGNTPSAGVIQFRYGEGLTRSQQLYEVVPQRGDIIVFPNWLEHQVYPFQQPGIERVSVAGNVLIYNWKTHPDNPNNQAPKQA